MCSGSKASGYVGLAAYIVNRCQTHIGYVKHVPDVSQVQNDFTACTVSSAYLRGTDLTDPECVGLHAWTSPEHFQLPFARELEVSGNYWADQLATETQDRYMKQTLTLDRTEGKQGQGWPHVMAFLKQS